MNKMIKYFLYLMPIVLLITGATLAKGENRSSVIAPLLILFFFLYVILVALIPYYGGSLFLLNIIHFTACFIALSLLTTFSICHFMIGYGSLAVVILWLLWE